MPMGPHVLLLLCHVSIAAAVPSSVLAPFCAFTDYPDLCLSSIQYSASPSLPPSLDVGSAADLQIAALSAAARSAVAFARTLPADSGGCLKQCVHNYGDGTDNVDAARSALQAGDRGTAVTMLSAAYDSFGCSDVYVDGAAAGKCRGPSPLKDREDVLTKLTSNSLAICQHLHY